MSAIKVIPLGGVRENGKSLYVVEVEEDLFILDCGLVYPEEEMLGIDAVIPDFTYLEENKDRIVGIFLTHGHADAVGALPYFLQKIDVPVFGTELTIALAKLFVQTSGIQTRFNDYHVINEKTEIDFETATVGFFKTTHTIPDSVGIVIKTQDGSIVYTGDFKFDQSATPEYQTNFGKIADIGEENVLLLLSDSSDAESPVENISDRKVAEAMMDTFRNATGRIIVACVSSNILRIQQVFNAAAQSKRRIFLTGSQVEEIIDIAIRLNKLTIPTKDLFVSYKEMKKLADDELVIVETGATGEPIRMLQKMALGRHKQIQLHENDLVYIATTPSSAMETKIARTKDMIYRAEAEVFEMASTAKASGHATPNDLKLMMNLLKPTFVIPVQGQYRQLVAHTELAHELGIPYKNMYVPSKGDVIEINDGKLRVTKQVQAGNVLVDGIGVGDIGNVVLKDRKILSEDGIVVVSATISRRLGKILAGPTITSRGFVYMKNSRELIAETQQLVKKVIEQHLATNDFEWNRIKQDMRETVSRHLTEQTKRRPIVLPIVMEASHYQKD